MNIFSKSIAAFFMLFFLLLPVKSVADDLVFPIFSYSKDFGSIYGLYYYKPLDESKKAMVYTTFMKASSGYQFWLGLKKYPINPDWQLETKLAFSDWKELYYGLGNSSLSSNSETIYRRKVDIDLAFRQLVSATNSIGYHVTYLNRDELESKNARSYFADFAFWGFGVDYQVDTRDRSMNSRSGQYFLLRYDYFPSQWYETTGTLDTTQRLTLDYRQFIPFYDGTLAYRTYLVQGLGSLHYAQLSKLGGSLLLRGASSGQYRDKALTSFQVEYRRPLAWMLSTAFFLEWGQVGSKIGVDDLHMSQGFGLYFNFGDGASALRLDTAFYQGKSKFYFMFNHAF